MEWLKIDKENLPKDEVLAANFILNTYGYKEKLLGYFHIENNIIICENENEQLENCSHYIPIHTFDIN
jgi:hypothetical protein